MGTAYEVSNLIPCFAALALMARSSRHSSPGHRSAAMPKGVVSILMFACISQRMMFLFIAVSMAKPSSPTLSSLRKGLITLCSVVTFF